MILHQPEWAGGKAGFRHAGALSYVKFKSHNKEKYIALIGRTV
jgi:hypothetical protein